MLTQGYSVQITRADGSTFLASSVAGILPPVWTLAQRKFAAEHCRDLKTRGFKAKVVRVKFERPSVIPDGPTPPSPNEQEAPK